METIHSTTELEQFRYRLYQNIDNRADTMLDLLDALSSNTTASTVVELSLNPLFRRGYSSLFKGIGESNLAQIEMPKMVGPFLPHPQSRKYWLLGVDVTSNPRVFAPTLADRTFVHQPNLLQGNKPVTIGHAYSTVVLLPEAIEGASRNWVVPMSTRRVGSDEDTELVGAEQIAALLIDPQVPINGELCVEVCDSKYSKPGYLHANRAHTNLVTITRVRSNRVLYRQPEVDPKSGKAGHPTWFGERFALSDPATWHVPEQESSIHYVSQRGKQYRVVLQGWSNMLMRGRRTPNSLPMQRHPFTLVRVCVYNAADELVFRRPMWLLAVGPQRHQLSVEEIYTSYRQRFDQEHFYRFSKQKLLMTAYQTPEVDHEENWWTLVHLAYTQLWLARPFADSLPRPWERYLPGVKARRLTPSMVQRDLDRIIRHLGTPAQPPKPYFIAPGRPKGLRLTPRTRKPVIKKPPSVQLSA